MSRLLNNISSYSALWIHAPTFKIPATIYRIKKNIYTYTQIRTTNNSKIDLMFPCTSETGIANTDHHYSYTLCVPYLLHLRVFCCCFLFALCLSRNLHECAWTAKIRLPMLLQPHRLCRYRNSCFAAQHLHQRNTLKHTFQGEACWCCHMETLHCISIELAMCCWFFVLLIFFSITLVFFSASSMENCKSTG